MTKFRRRSYRRGPLPFPYVLLISFVFFILSTALGLWIVNQGIKPTLISYADSQTKKIAPMVVNQAVKDVLPEMVDITEVTERVTDDSGRTSVQYKTDVINRLSAELSQAIESNLRIAESGNLEALQLETGMEIDYDLSSEGDGIVYSFPLGQATNNALLGNLGPKIPIRFTAIGNVQTNVESKVEQYPINNIFITVVIKIEVNVEIIIPFGTDTAVVHQEVPVAIGLFPGDVPQFYNGEGTSSPSIQLPINP